MEVVAASAVAARAATETTFEDLPWEIRKEILGYLSVNDLLKMARVSRGCRDIVYYSKHKWFTRCGRSAETLFLCNLKRIMKGERAHPPLEALSRLASMFGVTAESIRNDDYDVFRVARTNDKFKIFFWLISHFQFAAAEVLAANENYGLQDVCAFGRLKFAKWLDLQYGLTTEMVRTWDNAALRTAAADGNLKLVKWLVTRFQLTPADIRSECSEALRLASSHGHFGVIKWLLSRFDERGLRELHETNVTTNLLHESCKYGFLNIAQWLVAKFPFNLEGITYDLLSDSCGQGHLKVARWIANKTSVASESVHYNNCKILAYTCNNGHLEVAQWLVKRFEIKSTDIDTNASKMFNRLLLDIATRCRLEVLKWLAITFNLSSKRMLTLYKSFVKENTNERHLEVAKWILEQINPQDIKMLKHDKNLKDSWGQLLQRASFNENCLEIMRWLIDTHDLTIGDILNRHCCLMTTLCSHGDRESAAWLVSKFQPSALRIWSDSPCAEVLLENACRSGNLETAKWVVDTFKPVLNDRSIYYQNILKSASQEGHLDILKWFMSTFQCDRDDVRNFNYICLYWAASRGHFDIVKWIVSTFEVTIEDLRRSNNEILRSACISGNFEIAQWLISNLPVTINDMFDSLVQYRSVGVMYAICLLSDLEKVRWVVSRFNIQTVAASAAAAAKVGIDFVKLRKGIIDCLGAACRFGNIGLAQWLIAIFKITIKEVRESEFQPFCEACAGGCLETVRWVVSHFRLTQEDVTANDNRALVFAINGDCESVVKWFHANYKW